MQSPESSTGNGQTHEGLAHDPILETLQKRIHAFSTQTAQGHAFQERDADALAAEGRALPEIKKIFGNYVLESAAVLFPSERGVGKTFFLMQLCLSISKGYHRFLNEDIERHGNTLYLAFELGERTFKRRLAKLYTLLDHSSAPTSPYRMWVVNAKGSLARSMDRFNELLQQYQPVLVVVDNLRTAFRETDNEKNNAMTGVTANLMDLKNEKGFALVVAHHTKKNTASQLTHSDLQSGAGAISDLFDADFFLRRSSQDKQQRLLVRKKSRFCEESEGAKLIHLNPDTLWFDFVADDVDETEHLQVEMAPCSSRANADGKDEQILDLVANGVSQRQIVEQLHISFRRIQEARKRSGTTATGNPQENIQESGS